ncbi:MAG: YmdB family metallophosphoesterase, partial [Candidatus Aminicenantales bacterium]
MHGRFGLLFLGDIIGRPGRRALRTFLPRLIERFSPSFVIANGENAAGGIGITAKVCQELLEEVDVLTSGNHIWDKREVMAFLDQEPRLLRPANYPPQNPGRGTAVFSSRDGEKVGVLNLQGRVFMEPIDCPFRTADHEIEKMREKTKITVVDF